MNSIRRGLLPILCALALVLLTTTHSAFADSGSGAVPTLPEPALPAGGPSPLVQKPSAPTSPTPTGSETPLQASAQAGAAAGPSAATTFPPADDYGAVETARLLKATLSYDPLTGYGVFERPELRASFALGVPWITLDQNRTIRVEAPRPGVDGPIFPAATAALLKKAFAAAAAAKPPHYTVAAIVIDPGHGGKDPGTTGEHVIDGKRLVVVEKNLTLDVGLQVYRDLKAHFPDRRILITRTGDTYPTLEERVAMANSVKLADNQAVIYVSIHANASFNKTSRGFEVWYLDPNYRRTLISASPSQGSNAKEIAPILNAMLEEEFTTESIILAKNISAGLQDQVGSESPNRGIRPEEWFVVRNARMPAVLVEMGFVTNRHEAELLSREDYLRRIADGIYNGIVNFVEYFESMKGAPAR